MAEKVPDKVEAAPDPEEDDLDDLDDVLDEFQATSITPAKSSTTSPPPTSDAGPGRPPRESEDDPADAKLPSDDEMAAQLQAGMSSLISELDSNPEMQKEFEQMMQELIAAGSAPTDAKAAEHIGKAAESVGLGGSEDMKSRGSGGGASDGKKPDFNDTIRKTMERIQASGDAATAASSTKAASAFDDNDILAAMMKEFGEGGAEGGEDFNSLLMNMMAQLTHKDILYEPMKELHDKFPEWIEKNRGTCGAEDMARYVEQQKLVGEIVGRFERSGYSDDNADDREYIVDKMQLMQAAGSPPPDLVGDMSAAQEALGDLEGGCPTQ